MARTLYDHGGRPVRLGSEVGRGGEGSVYGVEGAPEKVAKLYQKAPSPERVQKLVTMVRGASQQLVGISAWPTQLLFDRPGGHPVGFVMPRIQGHRELHELYSPAHRKQEFPEADWRFLVHTARNLAAALDTVHASGHVIGDLNQKGVLVSPQGLVKLIDCDSFQIQIDGRVFPCEVGVSDFTPPELQGRSLAAVRRTVNHDAFGLAVLGFQLLFMGRHPFAGRYQGPGEDSLEEAIRSFRFAYGRMAASKHVAPPPASIELHVLPVELGRLFERAFGEEGSRGHRPTAQEWMTAFDRLLLGLRPCSVTPVHIYPAHLTQCPWCQLERAAGIAFFLPVALPSAAFAAFDLDSAWERISAAPRPAPVAAPPPQPPATPTPLPAGVRGAVLAYSARQGLGWGGMALVLTSWWLGPWAFFTGLALGAWGLRATVSDDGVSQRLWDAARAARERLGRAQASFDGANSDRPFERTLRKLAYAREQHRNLGAEYQRELEALRENIRGQQLRRFLEGSFIDRAKIDLIGPGRKAVLASFGIETAADVNDAALARLSGSGFGPTLKTNLLTWRASVESSFRFDPSRGVDPKDKAALDQRIAQQRTALEEELRRGPATLESVRQERVRERERCRDELAAAMASYAQASADVSLIPRLPWQRV